MRKRSVSFRTTADGLRMIHLHIPGAAVGYCGVAVRVGSRDEDARSYGLAHFVEHTIFKGTEKRSSWHIINRMEAVGGELNAFTTKEETVVYSAFPSGNLTRGAELIADLIISSRFPEKELEKEREVVADEIDSYLDSPAEAVFDDFEDLIFAGSPLGHNILGTRDALASFTSRQCRDYLRKWYVPENMVVFYAGSMSSDRVFGVFDRYFAPLGDISRDRTALTHGEKPGKAAPFCEKRVIDSHQCHTVIGSRICSLDSPQRFAAALYTNILGGPGMNSLLNIALREKRGLVYSVDATTGLFSDCGVMAVYYGCDPKDNDLCRKLIVDTIDSVSSGYLTSRRLEAAKKQYLGQVVIAGENIENHILAMARHYLFTGQVTSRSEMTEAIRAISPADMQSLSSSLELSSITLGPE